MSTEKVLENANSSGGCVASEEASSKESKLQATSTDEGNKRWALEERNRYIEYLEDSNDEKLETKGKGDRENKSSAKKSLSVHAAGYASDDECQGDDPIKVKTSSTDVLQYLDEEGASSKHGKDVLPVPQTRRNINIAIGSPVGAFARDGIGGANDMDQTSREIGEEDLADPSNREQLVEASPVEDGHSPEYMLEAQPVDLDQQEAIREAKAKQAKKFAFVFIALVSTIVALSLGLGLGLGLGNDTKEEASSAIASPTTLPLPPMENLDTLYGNLPEKSRLSLYNSSTPQYAAWEWLLDHPNITNLDEWRKEQLFGMATFFHSFQGPNWSASIRERWMNPSTSECSWGPSQETIAYLLEGSRADFVDAYNEEDYQTCDYNGRVQSLLLPQLLLKRNSPTPVIPPEVQLLTSLRVLSVLMGSLKTKLSDLLLPELLQLSSLEQLSFAASSLSGTIPKQVSQMTALRHLFLGSNKLTGNLPSEISRLSNLEYFGTDFNSGITGTVPTELGLLTSLTHLTLNTNSLVGTIPSELGLMASTKKLVLSRNSLTGGIPSEMGFLTHCTGLFLAYNQLTVPIPTELGLLSRTMEELGLGDNYLFGVIPSQLGLLTATKRLYLGNDEANKNNFSGSIPPQFWQFSNTRHMYLENLPHLHGSVPLVIELPNLTDLALFGSPHIVGTLPLQVCDIDDLKFDCTSSLCGCDCQCVDAGASNATF